MASDWSIGHCRNVRGLEKSMHWLFSVCLKNQDIQMRDQLNLRVLTKNRSIWRSKMAKW